MPEVLNCRVVGRSYPGAVYIGRPSIWGNPFVVGVDGTRHEVVEKYREYIVSTPMMSAIEDLRGKDLVCWCAPEACHGDVLLELANKPKAGIGNLDLLKE